jgi:hypothetical protein
LMNSSDVFTNEQYGKLPTIRIETCLISFKINWFLSMDYTNKRDVAFGNKCDASVC